MINKVYSLTTFNQLTELLLFDFTDFAPNFSISASASGSSSISGAGKTGFVD